MSYGPKTPDLAGSSFRPSREAERPLLEWES